MCEKCFDFGGWFLTPENNRVFCLLEDRHGYHAKDMRGTYVICECKTEDSYFDSPDHQGRNEFRNFEHDQDWFGEENLDPSFFS